MLSTLLNRGVENDEPAVSLFPVMYNDVYDDLEFYVAEQNKGEKEGSKARVALVCVCCTVVIRWLVRIK